MYLLYVFIVALYYYFILKKKKKKIEILIVESLQKSLAGTHLDNKICIHCCCTLISRGRV